ncbi:small integral membrane protein 45 isoform 2-T2 [Dama dama]|nr:small integral membrane protein 45 isoform X2 [Dama dama]
MPHFLDWFVPVYLFISVLILVGFGACIYYFEPGLQEAHKWRMQRPLVDRDFRKTLMVRDNLAFGGPEVKPAHPTPALPSSGTPSCSPQCLCAARRSWPSTQSQALCLS